LVGWLPGIWRFAPFSHRGRLAPGPVYPRAWGHYCGFFGGSLCASSDYSLSTNARISAEMASTPFDFEQVLVQPLEIGLHHDLAANEARAIYAALFGHRLGLFVSACRPASVILTRATSKPGQCLPRI